jgi:hypothetical protein
MPMIVTQSRTPVTRWPSASHHPASTNHRTFAMACTPLCRSGRRTSARPNGHRANPASLKACSPNGMPMMVMHMSTPAIRYAMAIQMPDSTSQMRLSSRRTARG